MLPWSVCIAFKNPVQELWAARSYVFNSKALCSLRRIIRILLGSVCIAFKTPLVIDSALTRSRTNHARSNLADKRHDRSVCKSNAQPIV